MATASTICSCVNISFAGVENIMIPIRLNNTAQAIHISKMINSRHFWLAVITVSLNMVYFFRGLQLHNKVFGPIRYFIVHDGIKAHQGSDGGIKPLLCDMMIYTSVSNVGNKRLHLCA